MIIDSHCHLQMEDYSNDLPSVLSKAKENGICSFIVIGFDLQSSIKAKELSQKYDFIHPVYGIHPYDTKEYDISVFSELEDLIREFPPLAIGETGLDYYRDISPKDKQKNFFNRHIELASRYNLPLVIHLRDAFNDAYDIMKGTNRRNDILHCFTGQENDINRFSEFNMYFGISGIVTFKNNELSKLVNLIPQDRILIETDSPYLAPVPKRGKRNEPANLSFILETISNLLGKDKTHLINMLLENTRNAYRYSFNEC